VIQQDLIDLSFFQEQECYL